MRVATARSLGPQVPEKHTASKHTAETGPEPREGAFETTLASTGWGAWCLLFCGASGTTHASKPSFGTRRVLLLRTSPLVSLICRASSHNVLIRRKAPRFSRSRFVANWASEVIMFAIIYPKGWNSPVQIIEIFATSLKFANFSQSRNSRKLGARIQ